MSSLAASKSDNFYYPPEWEPSMGSISKFQGSKGKDQYEQHGIIRFELPFDAWCLKCNLHMSKGLRFNAKKDRAGKYFTTTIWTFTTKCYDCNQPFVIRTNPKDSTYDFDEGLRKHEQDYDIGAEEGVVELTSEDTRVKLDNDPMFRLQHTEEDKSRTKDIKQNLLNLQQLQQTTQRSDYDMNSALRSKNRSLKKKEHHMIAEGRKRGLAIPLLESNEEDKEIAKDVNFRLKKKGQAVGMEKHKLLIVQSQSIFGEPQKESENLKTVQTLLNNKVELSNFKTSQSSQEKETALRIKVQKRKKVEDSADTSVDALSLLSQY